jgi:hypothetical protein
MLDHAEVVGDEERSDPEVLLQVHEQIEDLRLNAHIERAHRLVGNDEFRLACKRRGDTDALALPARKMRGQAVDQRRVEPHASEEIEHAPVAFGRRTDAEAIERFPYAAANRPARVKAAIGVLEHRLHAAAKFGECGACQTGDISAVETDGAAVRTGKAEDAAPECGFPAAALADESQRLAPLDADRHLVERRDGFTVPERAARGIGLPQSFDSQQLSHARPPSGLRAAAPLRGGFRRSTQAE